VYTKITYEQKKEGGPFFIPLKSPRVLFGQNDYISNDEDYILVWDRNHLFRQLSYKTYLRIRRNNKDSEKGAIKRKCLLGKLREGAFTVAFYCS